MSAGEVIWVGVEPLGERDGRIALYLTDQMTRLRPPFAVKPELEGRAAEILEYLREHGASFFGAIHEGTGGGFPAETVDALWSLVWQGLVTNDTMQPLRAYARTEDSVPPGGTGPRRSGRGALCRRAPKDDGPRWAHRARPNRRQRNGRPRWHTSCSCVTASSRAKRLRPNRSREDFRRFIRC